MKLLYMLLFFLISATTVLTTNGALNPRSVSDALNEFAFRFLGVINSYTPKGRNVAVSPYTIWTALAIVSEGARGNTAAELDKILGLPSNEESRSIYRKVQEDIIQKLAQQQDGVQLDIVNSLFTKIDAKLRREFQQLVKSVYSVQVEALNFTDSKGSAQYINNKLNDATHGRIPQVVNEDVLKDVEMVLTSALFFKGLWDKRFDRMQTRLAPFYDENGKIVTTVSMMQNSGNFPYASILENRATAVELPYKGDRMSMIVVLPNRGVSLHEVLMVQAKTPLHVTLEILNRAREVYEDSTIMLALPKFKLTSDLQLNDLLMKMGIIDIFGEHANLKGIADGQLYVSCVTHKAQIEVDEDGTVGSAVTVVEITDRIQAPAFIANKPFAFFVVDKLTHTTVLMGTVSNPK